ncbi:MAG: glycosyltransferase [Armatimonadota bacterium]|nr:glycosyltransferase [Armatimonadota bacterium]
MALPHAHVDERATVCAFTQKVRKFCRMLGERGWEIVLYAGADSQPAGASELVPLFSEAEREEWYGPFDLNRLPLVAGAWSASQPSFRVTNERAVAELRRRLEPGDLVLLTGGLAQKPIAEALPGALVAEWAAGYEGWFASFVCFESSAWRHHCYGQRGINDGRWYDAVIPNFFDPHEWPLCQGPGDYLLFMGRLTARKGPHVAAEVARAAGMPLLVAGAGCAEARPGLVVCQDGTRLEGDVRYLGTVGGEERARLMAGARALLAPTLYVEPFGAVAVEAQLCGTPAITTDWGAFAETVVQGVTGFRFHTLAEGVEAVERAGDLDPGRVRAEALARYSLEAVAPLYEQWLQRLAGLWGDGWYTAPHPALAIGLARRGALSGRRHRSLLGRRGQGSL